MDGPAGLGGCAHLLRQTVRRQRPEAGGNNRRQEKPVACAMLCGSSFFSSSLFSWNQPALPIIEKPEIDKR